LRTSVVTFEIRLQKRFYNLAADAARAARDDQEHREIRRLVAAVDAGMYPMRDARDMLLTLRSEQLAQAA
jgi:hypothetical protein